MSDQIVKATPCAGGFVRADGVMIGKIVKTPQGPALQVCDKDRRRSSERGSRYVLVDLSSLAALAAIPSPETKVPPSSGGAGSAPGA